MGTKQSTKIVVAAAVAVGGTLFASTAKAAPQLQKVYDGSDGVVVFIHGKSDCSTNMTDCNGGDATSGPAAYWTNNSNNATLLNEATTKYDSNGAVHYYAAYAIGYDLASQGFWYSANDVAYCLRDLINGTNDSGCNGSGFQASTFTVVTHSAGGTVIDRILSSGWWPDVSGAIHQVLSLAPALAGSRASSALYGVDGYGGFCSSLVSWLAGWALQNNGAWSLTRGAVMGEANNFYQGRSPQWINKITTTGGSWSANNDGCGTLWNGTTVREDDNDCEMGALAGCLGYSNSDDMDGLLYWSDSDPTNNPGANGCNSSDTYDGSGVSSCKYYSQFTGNYWHWFTSWANHSHSRDDAYTTLGDWQSNSGCSYRSPGTCVGQYGVF